MKIRAAVAALALLPTAGLALAASPAEADCADLGDGVLACETVGYLSCEDTDGGKVKTLQPTVGLDAEAPTTSFTAGGGCGMTEVPFLTSTVQGNFADLSVNDRMVGNVDTVTVEVHGIYGLAGRVNETTTLDVRLTVDGLSPSGYADQNGATGDAFFTPASFDVTVTPVASDTGASHAMVFTITDWHAAFPELNELGTGDRHRVQLDIQYGNSPDPGVWVWGATEVPASITFNGEIRGTVLSALTIVSNEG